MLEVLVPAENKQLTTLAAVKEELGIPADNIADDDVINSFIEQASDAIVRFCNRPFAKESYRETVPGYGTNRLMLSRAPVVEITSVVANSETITDYLLEDAEAGILFRERGWKWAPALGWNITWQPIGGSESLNFTVEYTAGYVLPGDAGTRTLPHDIERACIDTVKAWYQTKEGSPLVASERLGDYQVSYVPVPELPVPSMKLLAPWRRLI